MPVTYLTLDEVRVRAKAEHLTTSAVRQRLRTLSLAPRSHRKIPGKRGRPSPLWSVADANALKASLQHVAA